MRHPIERYNQIQAEELAELLPHQRAGKAFLNRIGNAAYCYHLLFNNIADEEIRAEAGKTPQDLIDWLDRQLLFKGQNGIAQVLLKVYFDEFLIGLPDQRIRDRMAQEGLEQAKLDWSFRRYVLERNDFGMEEFMRLNLGDEDYILWQELTAS